MFFLAIDGRSVPVLFILDQGTHFHIADIVRATTVAEGDEAEALREAPPGTPSSYDTFKTFEKLWLRYFGRCTAILTDGGSGFGFQFARGVELLGVLHQVTNRASPWGNGKVERHGGVPEAVPEKELLTTDHYIE